MLAPRLYVLPGPLVHADLAPLEGATRGRSWSATGARAELRRLATLAGVRRRFAQAPAPACACGRNGTGRRAAAGDPASAWSCPPGRDQHLPPGHRHDRDHQHRPRAQGANDPGERRPSTLTSGTRKAGTDARLPQLDQTVSCRAATTTRSCTWPGAPGLSVGLRPGSSVTRREDGSKRFGV
jgi:hypothetical protein